jgi:hypothetical protein
VVVPPDQRAVRDHLRSSRFRAGVADGRWRLVCAVEPEADASGNVESLIGWPFVIVAITAAPTANSPGEFAIRFEMSGYPHAAPTGGIWDIDADLSLAAERRPKGPEIVQLFRTDGWTGGATAMYAPWDRVGLASHLQWAQTCPHSAWNPSRDLSFILENVHGMLNSDEYLGV